MAVRKIKGSWYVDFSWKCERFRRLSPVDTRSGAQEYELFLRREIVAHGSLDHLDPKKRPKEPTFAEFAERWLSESVDVKNRPMERSQKRSILRAHLLPAFGGLRISGITTSLVDQFIARQLERGIKAKTVNNQLSALRTCMAKAVDWCVVASAPRIHRIPVAPPPFVYLSSDESGRLVQTMGAGVLRAMLVTALDAGLRFSELLALRWHHVEFDRMRLRIEQSEVRGHVNAPKNGRVRYVPLTPRTAEELSALARSGDRVFMSGAGPVSYWIARVALRAACAASGVRMVSWHALRHTFASELSRRGAPIQVVKDLLGHSSLEMTVRYAHVSEASMRDAVALLSDPRHPGVNRGATDAFRRVPEARFGPSNNGLVYAKITTS